MSHDTFSINQQMAQFDHLDSVWLFGYGSLIFKPDFPYLARQAASIRGWSRRFWQGSHDHRGTFERPGRVVTLIQDSAASCAGMAYLITPEVFSHLDYREKNGYLRFASEMQLADGRLEVGLVYIATEENAAFLGAADEAAIARQIAQAQGPSGSNREYLLKLAQSLRELGQIDEHVFGLEKLLLEVSSESAYSARA